MKAEELRIGNYVNATIAGEIHSLLALHKIIDGKDIDNSNWYFPIPLTEEWLLKFGFENHGSGLSKSEADKHLVLLPGKDVFFPYLEQDPEMSHQNSNVIFLRSIEFVHDLQNLFYAIFKTELTLKDE